MNYSAVFGLLSAGFLAVPVIRQEFRRREYAKFLKHHQDTENDVLAKAAKNYMLNSSISWSLFDSCCALIGVGLLGVSFILEIF